MQTGADSNSEESNDDNCTSMTTGTNDEILDGTGSETGSNMEQNKEDRAFFKYIVTAIREKRIHQLRSGASLEIFKRYCEICLPVIVGRQHWKMNHAVVGVRALATVADESLIAIILENNIEEWMQLARGGKINPKNRLTLYTHGGTDSKGRKKGWSLNGLKRYNELHGQVKTERSSDNADEIEEQLKELWKKERYAQGIEARTQDRMEQEEEEVFEPVFDFDD